MPVFPQDQIVFGILAMTLGFVFYTSSSENKYWKKFYAVIPALLMCYLIPSLFNTFGVISDSTSGLYSMAKDYLLPTSLVLLTLSIDFKGILRLGNKALIMFFTATAGIVIGGPIAVLILSFISPEVVGGAGNDAVWRGLATLAGSWIGGGANQAAMLEMYEYNQSLYAGMVAVDIIVANIWMAFLLWGAGRSKSMDNWLKADSSSIDRLKERMESYRLSVEKMPTLTDTMVILGIGFGATSLSHFVANIVTGLIADFGSVAMQQSVLNSHFFWLVVTATTIGLLLSFTRARNYEGAGASRIGSVFIYILVATIGMKMDVTQTFDNPGLLAVGLIWMGFHVLLLFIVAKIIRSPFFFLAVGSKANVGGAASAPVVASAFHPSLASVGVLLAVLGYALGTYGAILAAEMMRIVSP